MSESERAPARRPLLLHARVSVDPEVLSEPIGEEMVLVHMGTDCIYELNRSASIVWKLLQDGCSPHEIVRQVQDEFEVDETDLRREIDDFIRELSRDKLVDFQ